MDFTKSNGMPNDPNSLHYFDRERLENPYTMAIRTVGDIVQDYDYGKYCLKKLLMAKFLKIRHVSL